MNVTHVPATWLTFSERGAGSSELDAGVRRTARHDGQSTNL
jgi:hypothetical protein